jgi:hypothetical protein
MVVAKKNRVCCPMPLAPFVMFLDNKKDSL